MTPTDFAEAVHKAAGRYSVYSRADVGIYEVRDGIIHIETFSNFTAAQAETDRLNREAVRAIVGPLVEALQWYREQGHLCRLIHSGGDTGRNALAQDGGKRATAALATLEATDADQ